MSLQNSLAVKNNLNCNSVMIPINALIAAHGYKLIEIPYTDIDRINKYLNFLQKNKEEA